MLRIGFIDRYLDNWHTNHYPEYLKAAAQTFGFDAGLTAAWAAEDHPNGGLTTDEWCARQGVQRAMTYRELIDCSEVLMVMCADDCLPHEALAQAALASGKPVYCDKTFAPDLPSARRMFDQAQKYNTPVFTCSAQRYCLELSAYMAEREKPPVFCATTGPGDIVNYSIHQFEMIERVMGVGAVRSMALSAGDVRHIVYEYRNGGIAAFTQSPKAAFRLFVSDGAGSSREITVAEYYMGFMHVLLKFFTDRIPPVKREDTLEIMAMQQAGRAALATPGAWIFVPTDR